MPYDLSAPHLEEKAAAFCLYLWETGSCPSKTTRIVCGEHADVQFQRQGWIKLSENASNSEKDLVITISP